MYKPNPQFRDAKEMFPPYDADSDYVNFTTNYGKVISSMNLYSVLFVEEDDYQGESLMLLHNDSFEYGILNFSWGSCSWCDELQACESYDDFDELRHSLFNKIYWGGKEHGMDSKQLVLSWLKRDLDGLEAIPISVKTKFNKMLEIYIQGVNFDEERKARVKEAVYQKLVTEKTMDELIKMLDANDMYGKSFYKIDEDLVKEVLL